MLGKKMIIPSIKLSKKMKVKRDIGDLEESSYEKYFLLKEFEEESSPKSTDTPTGYFPIYVGVDRQRFIVPTGFLSHPLFKMLLEKAYDEFGFDQRDGLVIPCSVSTFQEVSNAVECCNGKFEFGKLVEEFI